MRMRLSVKIILVFLSTLLALALCELTLRVFIRPCDECYGKLFRIRLPPFTKILSPLSIKSEAKISYDQYTTLGDLNGVHRDDDIIGYVPQEGAVSSNGWWYSNNLGARSEYCLKNKNNDKKRILIFGESFALGYGVLQKKTWPYVLEKKDKRFECINFAVSGYSMGQSLLRYNSVRKKIDHDLVLFMFVPSADLWREINVVRVFARYSWNQYKILPRFVIENNELKLVTFPSNAKNLVGGNNDFTVDKLKKYLRIYEAFYIEGLVDNTSFIEQFILYKLFIKAYVICKDRIINMSLMKSTSEAMQISKKIFQMMDRQAKQTGKKFVLIFLPTIDDLVKYRANFLYKKQWDTMVMSVSRQGIYSIDLMKDFLNISMGMLDRSYEGCHYGPRANDLIADFIRNHLAVDLYKG